MSRSHVLLYSVCYAHDYPACHLLCNNNGCIAAFSLDDGMKDALVKGITAEVVLTTADRREVVVDVSLKGFSAALNAL